MKKKDSIKENPANCEIVLYRNPLFIKNKVDTSRISCPLSPINISIILMVIIVNEKMIINLRVNSIARAVIIFFQS